MLGNSVNHIEEWKPGELGTMLDGKNTICSFGCELVPAAPA
jgi:hypothetical protein